jgi:hypothetical protein
LIHSAFSKVNKTIDLSITAARTNINDAIFYTKLVVC